MEVGRALYPPRAGDNYYNLTTVVLPVPWYCGTVVLWYYSNVVLRGTVATWDLTNVGRSVRLTRLESQL